MTDLTVHFSSARTGEKSQDNWRTPENVLERVRACFDGVIGCDPCTDADNPTGAEMWCNEVIDGLTHTWGPGTVYVNCPYSQIRPWLEKCGNRYAVDGNEIIALIPARTDTRAWHEAMATAKAFCLWRGRLTFVGAPAPAPFPSALLYWGERPWTFEAAFSDAGKVVRL